jgi:hypothetical protein
VEVASTICNSLCLPQICGTIRQQGSSLLCEFAGKFDSDSVQFAAKFDIVQFSAKFDILPLEIHHQYHTPQIVPSFATPQLLNIAYIFLLFLRDNLPQKGCSPRADEKVSHFQYYSYAIRVDRSLLLIFFFGGRLRVPPRR